MGLDVGGYRQSPDWPKLGPSLLIATCLILAIRKARQPVKGIGNESEPGLDQEIGYCAHLAGTVMMYLVTHQPDMFPSRAVPWYVPNEGDVRK